MNNFEYIKTLSPLKLAQLLTELQCQECGIDDWTHCEQIGCWCHKNNGYQTYQDWLSQEVSKC